ncbi:hypothetical protein NEDG_01948 [Nematocida displodere]|uniref:Proliferating cell nuclear antigen n=1 Tax=Nematocida displodere TaxID=1805483 RepID=A0A177EIW2_9MICR|nr:hypothetical protein NEDG_01948 [Nematocida displodere]
MEVLHGALTALKPTVFLNIAVHEGVVAIEAETPSYTVCARIPTLATGTGAAHTYKTEHALTACNNCTKITEENGTLTFFQVSSGFFIQRSIQPVIYTLSTEEALSEYTTQVSLKISVFKKLLPFFKDGDVTIFLSNGVLYMHASSTEGEDVLKLSSITIHQEGTDKGKVPFSALKHVAPLLPFCESISLMFNSTHLSLLLIFKEDLAHYTVVAGTKPLD